jgi:hypothetical protein
VEWDGSVIGAASVGWSVLCQKRLPTSKFPRIQILRLKHLCWKVNKKKYQKDRSFIFWHHVQNCIKNTLPKNEAAIFLVFFFMNDIRHLIVKNRYKCERFVHKTARIVHFFDESLKIVNDPAIVPKIVHIPVLCRNSGRKVSDVTESNWWLSNWQSRLWA